MDKKEIFAFDFDGTLCRNEYPSIGEPNYDAIRWIKELRSQGHKIILWTCREHMDLVNAIVWCAEQGIFFDAVNDNLEEMKKCFNNNSRKIFANYYVDDRAVCMSY